MKTPTKVIKNGKVAVLISPGFGAGWSSCAGNDTNNFLLFDAGLVSRVNEAAEKVEAWLKQQGIEPPYMGGWDKTEVQWVPQGELFYVNEYDGAEHIVFQSEFIRA